MRRAFPTGPFKRDLKRIEKRGWDVEKLQRTISLLLAGEPLPEIARPHKLSGEYAGQWECHIENNWLLVYYRTPDALILMRTGTHEELLG